MSTTATDLTKVGLDQTTLSQLVVGLLSDAKNWSHPIVGDLVTRSSEVLSTVLLHPTAPKESEQVEGDSPAATIGNHVTNVHNKTKALDAAITAFPDSGGSIIQALSIHTAVIDLVQVVKSATADANASTPFDETAGNAILVLVKEAVPTIQQAAANIVSKKAAISGIPIVGGVVTTVALSDLNTITQEADAFIAAFLAKAPAALVSAAQEQATLVKNALSDATTAYS